MPVILGGNTGIYLASLTPSVDPDAQAFITAAAITDPTQQAAINTLVVDLKGYNVWTKMKALYPFVGSTASQHKWNLKDPRDLDAAFRLRFFGDITHSSNGVKGGGMNGYFRTYLLANTDLPQDNNASGAYIRTNVAEDTVDYGFINSSGHTLSARLAGNLLRVRNYGNAPDISNLDSRGFYQNTRRNSTSLVFTKGTTKTSNVVGSVPTISNVESYGLTCNFSGPIFYSSRELAFHYYANSSMSDTELDNLYTAVQAFQVSLGRSIGTQTVSDADAQAFVTAADIQDQVEANAVNNLVIGLKADGTWSKMKAVYPFIGSTASQQKFNLKDPRDLDAAFRLQFLGGWTHSSTGATPNGTNAYANSFLNDNTVNTLNNTHISIYSRTNSDGLFCDIGVTNSSATESNIFSKYLNAFYPRISDSNSGIANATSSLGMFVSNRVNSTQIRAFQNGTLKLITSISTGLKVDRNYYLGAISSLAGNASLYSNRQLAFASIGDGLTDTDATNLNTRVTTFQTALNRNI